MQQRNGSIYVISWISRVVWIGNWEFHFQLSDELQILEKQNLKITLKYTYIFWIDYNIYFIKCIAKEKVHENSLLQKTNAWNQW